MKEPERKKKPLDSRHSSSSLFRLFTRVVKFSELLPVQTEEKISSLPQQKNYTQSQLLLLFFFKKNQRERKNISRQFNISGWQEEERSGGKLKSWTQRKRQNWTVAVSSSRASHMGGKNGEWDSVCWSFICCTCRIWEVVSQSSIGRSDWTRLNIFPLWGEGSTLVVFVWKEYEEFMEVLQLMAGKQSVS